MPLTRREFLKAVAILSGDALFAPASDVAAWLDDGSYYSADKFGVRLDGRYIPIKSIGVSFLVPRLMEPIDDADSCRDFLSPSDISPYWEAHITAEEPLFNWGCTRLFKRIETEFLLSGTVVMIGNCCITKVSQSFSRDKPVVSTVELWWNIPLKVRLLIDDEPGIYAYKLSAEEIDADSVAVPPGGDE